MTESMEDLRGLVETAEEAIRQAALVAAEDPRRPGYHFRAPAQWMDDPNGIIYHDGWYHMMYSLNPHSHLHRAGMVYKTEVRTWDPGSEDWTGGITVWGHARSRDLVHWEHLPIALYPAIDKGEHFIWFGCTVVSRQGTPMAFYTAVGPDLRPEDTAEQWAAVGSADLLHWKSLESNPLLTNEIHGGQRITEWRDPFLFTTDGRDFMILGARDPEGHPVVTLYEARDGALTDWAYRGIVFRHPEGGFPSIECPNFARIDGHWVLLISRHSTVEYFIGSLDVDGVGFEFTDRGMVDYSSNFYATNLLHDGQGRCLMWGAVEGFEGTSGWNGCVSLPRELRVSDGRLLQSVVPELHTLRRTHGGYHGPSSDAPLVSLGGSGTYELEIAVTYEGAADFVVELSGEAGTFPIEIGPGSAIAGLPIDHTPRDGHVRLSIWIDRTVVEVFVDGDQVATRLVPLWGDGLAARVLDATGGVVSVDLDAWTLETDGLFTS